MAQKIIKFSLIALGIILVAFLVSYYYGTRVNYLIPGVPYFGFYNSFLRADSSFVTSISDILNYWGDGRYSLGALKARFPKDKNNLYTIVSARDFFKANGYETDYWFSSESGQELTQIKKFVNPKNNIPVLIYQKRSPDSSIITRGYKVIIGVFDKDKKVVAHDHDLGNNYEISYKDFLAMFNKDARAILAVWPSSGLANELKKVDHSLIKYLQRPPEMSLLGNQLIKIADSLRLLTEYNKENCEKILPDYSDFLSNLEETNLINFLPPAHRVIFYRSFADFNLCADRFNEAIKIILEKVIPINKDLDKSYNNWAEQVIFFKENNITSGKFARPYYTLGKAYLQKGDLKAAKESFEEALKISPDYLWAREELEKLK